MTFWVAGAVVASGYMGSQAAGGAADTQAAASDRAAALSNEQYQQTRQDQMPFLQAGVGALNKLAPLASNYKPFDYNTMAQDPGYAFRLSEGQKALDRSAAARGGLISGSALKAATRFGQDMGSQEYQNAFNRYQTQRTNTLNPYASLAGVAQTSANTLGQAAGQYGANAGNIAMVGGANAGNAQLALGNIRGQQFSNAANALGQGYNFYKQGGFSDLFGGGGGSYSGPSYGTNPDFSNSDFDTMSYD